MSEENQVVDALNELFRVENAPYQLTPCVKVEELDRNARFGHGANVIRTVAYPKVVRAEDEVTHREAIDPALSVLSAPHFEVPNLEFRDALDEYRKGHYGDCLTKCGSAFESVLKVLCQRNGCPFNERDTAAPLLKLVVSNSTLDPFFEQPLILIATLRNRLSSSHGGGTSVRSVQRHVAQYAITSTAAAIVLLAHETGG